MKFSDFYKLFKKLYRNEISFPVDLLKLVRIRLY